MFLGTRYTTVSVCHCEKRKKSLLFPIRFSNDNDLTRQITTDGNYDLSLGLLNADVGYCVFAAAADGHFVVCPRDLRRRGKLLLPTFYLGLFYSPVLFPDVFFGVFSISSPGNFSHAFREHPFPEA